ncbi:MAG: hypothetical protein V1900_02090 [Candidatus Aenigmatarchaeota archaeon]
MEEVFLVKSEEKSKAELALRGDDLVGRQSITIKLASALGMKEDGYFIIVNGSDEAMKKVKELLKGIAEKYKDKENVLKKVAEEEDIAIEGFGNILG